jgi:hypothetical protein
VGQETSNFSLRDLSAHLREQKCFFPALYLFFSTGIPQKPHTVFIAPPLQFGDVSPDLLAVAQDLEQNTISLRYCFVLKAFPQVGHFLSTGPPFQFGAVLPGE